MSPARHLFRVQWIKRTDTPVRSIAGRHAAARFVLAATIASAALQASPTPNPVTPGGVVDSLEATFGVHPGQRRNHIKGTCANGEFMGTAEAATLSRSKLFSGASVPVIARFSLAGGNPNIADATRNARGMALEFELPGGGKQHMTMLNTPVFGAANPNTFNDMIVAARPDPATGKPDPMKLKQFLSLHPDAMAQADFLASNAPPQNYANSAYYGIHTFHFVDSIGTVQAVRWRFIPRDGEKRLTEAQLAVAPKDFLEQRLIERLSRGPAKWDMVVYVGEPGDAEDNATLAWPETRRHFVAGTLTITRAMPQSGAACEKTNFDPLVMADGIQPTNDPVLLFRSPAYAISFGKRVSNQ